MPYCTYCGKDISGAAVSCPHCGHPQVAAAPARRTEGTAIASLICGIAGVSLLPLLPSILAVVFGRQARARIASDASLDGEHLARAGTILGWVGIGLGLLIVAAIIVVVIVASTGGFGNGTDLPVFDV